MDMLEKQWVFLLGFGAPFTLATYSFSFFVSGGMYALLFPVVSPSCCPPPLPWPGVPTHRWMSRVASTGAEHSASDADTAHATLGVPTVLPCLPVRAVLVHGAPRVLLLPPLTLQRGGLPMPQDPQADRLDGHPVCRSAVGARREAAPWQRQWPSGGSKRAASPAVHRPAEQWAWRQ